MLISPINLLYKLNFYRKNCSYDNHTDFPTPTNNNEIILDSTVKSAHLSEKESRRKVIYTNYKLKEEELVYLQKKRKREKKMHKFSFIFFSSSCSLVPKKKRETETKKLYMVTEKKQLKYRNDTIVRMVKFCLWSLKLENMCCRYFNHTWCRWRWGFGCYQRSFLLLL